MNPWDPICAITQESKCGLYSHYKVQGQPLGFYHHLRFFFCFFFWANFVTVATKSSWKLSFLGCKCSQKICENDIRSRFHFLFYSQVWLKFSFICFTSCYGRPPLVLHLPMDDHHLFYIFLWMITTCFTSYHE
jgi:hypothetical protein